MGHGPRDRQVKCADATRARHPARITHASMCVCELNPSLANCTNQVKASEAVCAVKARQCV